MSVQLVGDGHEVRSSRSLPLPLLDLRADSSSLSQLDRPPDLILLRLSFYTLARIDSSPSPSLLPPSPPSPSPPPSPTVASQMVVTSSPFVAQ